MHFSSPWKNHRLTENRLYFFNKQEEENIREKENYTHTHMHTIYAPDFGDAVT